MSLNIHTFKRPTPRVEPNLTVATVAVVIDEWFSYDTALVTLGSKVPLETRSGYILVLEWLQGWLDRHIGEWLNRIWMLGCSSDG